VQAVGTLQLDVERLAPAPSKAEILPTVMRSIGLEVLGPAGARAREIDHVERFRGPRVNVSGDR
jgi:hypothetical protein